uniref:Uncharacterized protein n=1 Tax=Glossina austeni TaxID=7395 RepID=A0A1A9VNS4_GLOAU
MSTKKEDERNNLTSTPGGAYNSLDKVSLRISSGAFKLVSNHPPVFTFYDFALEIARMPIDGTHNIAPQLGGFKFIIKHEQTAMMRQKGNASFESSPQGLHYTEIRTLRQIAL